MEPSPNDKLPAISPSHKPVQDTRGLAQASEVTLALSIGSLAVAGSEVTTVGERLGRFEIRKHLGTGAFGTVYQAWDPELGRDVAIKVPRLEVVAASGGADAYRAEARAAAQLTHPRIVPVFDVGTLDDGRCFIVSQLITGSTLQEEIAARGKLALDRAVRLVVEIAEALHHAHERGFVHRDLKPANILLDKLGNPHVADLGLALHEDDQQHRAGEVAGTPAYMAPEQWRGASHHLDGRTDVWSLGVILYELLAGRRPFGGETREALVDEILHREAKPLRQIDNSIPRELEEVCLRCLAKDVTQRFPTAADVAEALLKAVQTSSVGASTAPDSKAPTRQLSMATNVKAAGCGLSVALTVTCSFLALTAFVLTNMNGRDEMIASLPSPDDDEGYGEISRPRPRSLPSPPTPLPSISQLPSEPPPQPVSEGPPEIRPSPIPSSEVRPPLDDPFGEPEVVTQPTSSELAELSGRMKAAKAALGDFSFAEADEALAKAEEVATLPAHQAAVGRLRTVAAMASLFHEAINATLAKLEPGDEIKIGASTEATIVEASPNELTIRIGGQNRTYLRNDLPLGLAINLGERALDAGDPTTLLLKGAYIFIDKRSDTAQLSKAKTWWKEAQLNGADIGGVLPLFDDNYNYESEAMPE